MGQDNIRLVGAETVLWGSGQGILAAFLEEGAQKEAEVGPTGRQRGQRERRPRDSHVCNASGVLRAPGWAARKVPGSGDGAGRAAGVPSRGAGGREARAWPLMAEPARDHTGPGWREGKAGLCCALPSFGNGNCRFLPRTGGQPWAGLQEHRKAFAGPLGCAEGCRPQGFVHKG